MKPIICIGLLYLAALGVAAAQTTKPAPPGPPACLPPGLCSATPLRRLSFPAAALSFGSPVAAFTFEARGVRWQAGSGVATLTLRRPADYANGSLSVSVFYEVLDDGAGDLLFSIAPVSFSHGNSFETYGDAATELLPAPGSPTILYQQTAQFSAGGPGYQWPPSGDWWYFEIRRGGSYAGPIRLMAVALDY